MATTHVAAGALLAVPLVRVAPDVAVAGALGGMVGGAVPDVDLFVGEHRRTLHFPVAYWLLAAVAGLLAYGSPTPLSVAVAVSLAAAAVHSGMDWFGAGDEPRPWERTSDRGVYLHVARRWLAPRYWVRYDGSTEDVLLTAALAAPSLVVFGPPVRPLLAAVVVLAVGYALVRRRLPDLLGL
jgi:hypothetical protein